ncbi:hypothetical protein AB6A40_009687 [Gnathostoma spinigerum]|uniref:Uncharacterized protein n=1 Tax=Gnathostoma spinigerum TaxID=75299 RepID=A0ABD6F0D6_9BILA
MKATILCITAFIVGAIAQGKEPEGLALGKLIPDLKLKHHAGPPCWRPPCHHPPCHHPPCRPYPWRPTPCGYPWPPPQPNHGVPLPCPKPAGSPPDWTGTSL